MGLGDTHGHNMAIAPHLLMQYGLDNSDECKAILHVGDFGVGFIKLNGDKLELEKLNNRLSKYNTYLFVIRGNHDDPKFFNDNDFKQENGFNDLSNIKLLNDHTLLTINVNGVDKNVYCNGGAYSIDRSDRIYNINYWVDEPFFITDDQLEELKGVKIDIILTHTRPAGVFPYVKGGFNEWVLVDHQLYFDLNDEADMLLKMFNAITNSDTNSDTSSDIHHLYGHFHTSNTEYSKGVKHQCLGISELIEIK